MLIWWVIVFAVLGGAGAALGSALILALAQERRRKALPWLISYATGVLLGAAFLAMIPEALTGAQPANVAAALLAGVVGFYALEQWLLWRHCHDESCETHGRAGALILVGDGFHNFVDGVVIAAAFLTSVPLGVAVSLAVIAHEIPQEVGDFAILLDNGYAPRTAFVLNTLSASTALPGALLGYFWLPAIEQAIPYVLAISAASFIYIALADLVPSLHKRVRSGTAALQFVLLLAGIATIALLHGGGQ